MIDDSRHPADNISVQVFGQPVLSLADLKSGIFAGRQGVHLHGLRNIVWIPFIKLVREMDKISEILSGLYWFNNSHNSKSLYSAHQI